MRKKIGAVFLAAVCLGIGAINSQESATPNDAPDYSPIKELSEIRSRNELSSGR